MEGAEVLAGAGVLRPSAAGATAHRAGARVPRRALGAAQARPLPGVHNRSRLQ